MSREINFGPDMEDFGRQVLREVVRTDFGPGCSFDGIDGHGLEDHHGGLHEQVVLFRRGLSDSEATLRFFKGE